MVKSKITVLGGSSPFTAALVDSIEAAQDSVPIQELVLHGRQKNNLELLERYAKLRLEPHGWTVCSTINLEEALDGANIVVHQIRYGSLSGRANDEQLATAFGLPADETLGPSAFQAALRMIPGLRDVARDLRRYCPDAWILNLTNPLSISTAVLVQEGLNRCVGLCELPRVTVSKACHILGLPLQKTEWNSVGLNHRGFIHKLSFEGRNYLSKLSSSLGKQTIEGITASDIADLNAIPLKYFRLFRGDAPAGAGRAKFLETLRQEIYNELRKDAFTSPPSLAKRYMDWYPYSVVPMITAISANDGRAEVVNIMSDDNIVWEVKAKIYVDRLEPLHIPAPEGPVKQWVERFAAHERAVLAAALNPSLEGITMALLADPILSGKDVEAVAKEIWKVYQADTTTNHN